eukprot:symbB.v1.2.017611.t1/scaffold1377.1/size122625/4
MKKRRGHRVVASVVEHAAKMSEDGPVALVRVASKAAFDLARLQPYVLDLELEPVVGEALTFSGFCRQDLRDFKGRCLGKFGNQLRIEVHGKVPEKGASGGPVVASGRAVAVHMGIFREESGWAMLCSLRDADVDFSRLQKVWKLEPPC